VKQVVAYLKQYFKNQSPEFIYQKTLFHVFGGQVQLHTYDDDALSRVGFKQTQIWQQLFEFQRDGVKGILDRLKQYHGCILADSVGLGKTYSALAVIKYYEMMNEKVLVLCPKKLEENWRSYLFNVKDSPLTADKLSYTVQFHTDLGRAALEHINWGAFDLIVIDESHNFRNNRINDNAEAPDVNINPTRYQFLMQQVVQAGKRSKLLLLSATPVNNSLIDLRNQISLIAGADVSKDHATDIAYSKRIGLASLDNTVKRAQSAFKQWAESKASERKKADLMTKLGGDFTLMLDKLSLARSREQIKRNFPQELATIGGFPTRAAVQSHKTTRIDLEENFPSYDEVVNILGQTYKSDKKSKQTNSNQADFLNDSQKVVDKKQGINLAMFMPSFYYLAYVRSDGTVQLGHAQAKAVLNLWRILSAGKTEAYETVCRAFDLATQGGKDMSAVSTLLQAATAHIKQAVQGTATVQLTLNRDFKLPAKLEENLAENAFELVTWLVIQDT
jgi:SNF2-related domain